MLFLMSAAIFAATVYLFLYAVRLVRLGALPKWADRDGVLHAAALAFTLIAPLSLSVMVASAPFASITFDAVMAVAVAVAVSVAARFLAVALAGGRVRRGRARV